MRIKLYFNVVAGQGGAILLLVGSLICNNAYFKVHHI